MSSHVIRRAFVTTAVAAVTVTGVMTGASAHAETTARAPYKIPSVQPKTIGGEKVQYDGGQYADMPAMQGAMSCDPGNPKGIRPVAGRDWMYYDPANDFSGKSADLVITGWESGAAAMKAISNDGTQCVLLDGWRQVAATPGYKLFTNGVAYDAVIRVGNLLVSVEAEAPSGTPAQAKQIAMSGASRAAVDLAFDYPAGAR
ncbi:hypothetical protein [Flexivirga oryzae]|uniref:Secreted protein n=1 Tax=Flexivirga oryzae TaxID=1794944 RepID=A0A839N8P1_9MICO|nr:hypothetical protein [Flexivirga oryzae]MBB2892374.1 hypothetical protein [Flexivirga oryzae]